MALVGSSLSFWNGDDDYSLHFMVDGKRFEVSDTPTPFDFDLAPITHPTVVPTGWRFQGTDDSGDSLVFDAVNYDDGRGWLVLQTYE
jgi:hypothetical protein